MNPDITYSQALEELESLLAEIENSEISVDSLTEKVKRATYLIGVCKSVLQITEDEVKRILEEMQKSQNKEL